MSDQQPDWLTLPDDQIRSEAIALGKSQSGLSEGRPHSFRQTIWETMAMLIQRVYQRAIRPIAANVDPRQAKGWYLRMHGVLAGEPWRDQAVPAKGYVTVTATGAGELAAATVIEAGGQMFTVDAAKDLEIGENAVAVTAAAGGAAGNVAAGTEAGWAEDRHDGATVRLDTQWITVPGLDADSDEELYRPRLLAGLQVRGEANTIARYRKAALAAPGVTGASVARTPRGYGSADVVVLVDRRVPTTTDLEMVLLSMARAGLVCRDLLVRAPDIVDVAVEAEITGTASVDDVQAAIDTWWRIHVGIGDGLAVQRLYREAAQGVPGLDTVIFSQPSRNLVAAPVRWYRPALNVRAA